MYQEFYDNKNDDYINRFKQKVAEQKIATIEERKQELARSRNNFLGTFAGIVLAGVVAWFVLSPQYGGAGKDVPTIHRPQTAVKVKPENPGGMEIPNQDKDVYDIVEKKDVDNTVVENLLPTPEQPKMPDIVPDEEEVIDANADNLDEIVTEVAEEADTTAENTSEAVADAENEMPAKPVDLLAENAQKADMALDEAVESAKQAEEEAKAAAEKAKAEAKAAEEKAKAEAKAAEEKAKAAAEKAKAEAKAAEEKAKAAANSVAQQVAGGKWQVQLVASGNRAAVEKTWIDLSGRYGAVLGGLSHEIQSADLGAKGMIYRLRAGSFASKEEAQKVCNGLKAKGMNDCIVKER